MKILSAKDAKQSSDFNSRYDRLKTEVMDTIIQASEAGRYSVKLYTYPATINPKYDESVQDKDREVMVAFLQAHGYKAKYSSGDSAYLSIGWGDVDKTSTLDDIILDEK